MSKNIDSITRKSWYKKTYRLSDLEEWIGEVRGELGPNADPMIVGVFDPPTPQEAVPLFLALRSHVIDGRLRDHLNAMAGQLTDAEIEDSGSLAAAALSEGEVVYIVFDKSRDAGATEVYKI